MSEQRFRQEVTGWQVMRPGPASGTWVPLSPTALPGETIEVNYAASDAHVCLLGYGGRVVHSSPMFGGAVTGQRVRMEWA